MKLSTLNTFSTAKLVELFALTNSMPMTAETPTVRGWIMDALEARNPEAFDKWLDMPNLTDAEETANLRVAFGV